MGAERRSGSEAWKKILLLGVSLAFSLALLELVLAKLAPQIKGYGTAFRSPVRAPLTSSAYLPTTTPRGMSFRHKTPEFEVVYHFNRFGYRGENPRQIQKPEGVKRILLLGDSFTLGWGNPLERTFAQRIADYVEPRGYRVINAGFRGGYTPDAYYAYLRREGLELEPDVAVVFLFSGNDVTEMRDNVWESLDERGMPLDLNTIRLYTDYNGAFLFPRGLENEVLGWNYRIPLLRESRAFIGVTENLKGLFLSAQQKKYRRLGKLREPEPPEVGWLRFEKTVTALNELCAERSIPIVWALISDVRPKPHNYDAMSKIVRESSATLVGLRPVLRPEFYFLEGHLNSRGNKAVAREIVAFLGEYL